jgi:hypothetical protein
MSLSLRTAAMTREAFLARVPPDGRRDESDGVAPVAMAGGTRRHAGVARNVLVVFEVLSPGSGRTDRIDKLREYGAVPSFVRTAILENRGAALTVPERAPGVVAWTASALSAGDVPRPPEIGLARPVAESCEGVDFTGDAADAPA